jgi:hypothetical protein
MPAAPTLLSLNKLNSAGAVSVTQSTLKNVEAAFARIPRKGEHLIANLSQGIPQGLYIESPDNYDGYQNHFQGLQRLGNGKFMAVTGGDPHTPRSELFVIKMGSRPKVGPWWPNLVSRPHVPGPLPHLDRVVTVVKLDDQHWHGGGMDVVGDVLAIPVEYPPPNTIPALKPGFKAPDFGDKERSKVLFLDMTDPAIPKRMPVQIARKGVKAGAVAFTRLPNGHYLVAVNGGKGKQGKCLDFYLSKTKTLNKGFRSVPRRWFVNDVFAVGEQSCDFGDYQTLNFVCQDDGELYLIGTHHTSKFAPIVNLRDYADLFHVQVPGARKKPASPTAPIEEPRITKVANLHVECKKFHGHFSAGSGAYVDRGTLAIYSAGYWRTKPGKFRFAEFRPPVDKCAGGAVKDTTAWVEMYEDTHFQGRRLAVLGTYDMFIPDFKRADAQGSGFGDKAESIRFQLPNGKKCLLYKHHDFKEKLYTLKGTGLVEEIRRLPDKVKGEISSMKCVS